MKVDIIINALIVLSLWGPTTMVAWRVKKRGWFVLRFLLCFALMFGTAVGFSAIFTVITDNYTYIWLVIIKFFVLYVLMIPSTMICFRCNFWAAIFCSTAGYCIEHMSQRFYSIFEYFWFPSIVKTVSKIISVIITGIFCAVVHYIILRKNKDSLNTLVVDHKLQIIVAAIAISVVVFINTLMTIAVRGSGIVYVYLTSLICALLTLIIEFNLLFSKKTRDELLTVKRILNEERLQYLKEKQNIDLINIKSHDLKHQISSLKGKLNNDEIKEITEAVEIYDSSIKTGNEALDVILTQKSLYCRQNSIKLTCLVDGAILNSIPEHELYSLFGNAIDNAIESVGALDPERRIISITEKKFGGAINIRIENYFSGDIKFENGLPATQKDRDYHGFGMKSIKLILDKYDGRLHAYTTGNIFTLDMFFADKSD